MYVCCVDPPAAIAIDVSRLAFSNPKGETYSVMVADLGSSGDQWKRKLDDRRFVETSRRSNIHIVHNELEKVRKYQVLAVGLRVAVDSWSTVRSRQQL